VRLRLALCDLAFGLVGQLFAAFCYIKKVFAKRVSLKRNCEGAENAGLFSKGFDPVHRRVVIHRAGGACRELLLLRHSCRLMRQHLDLRSRGTGWLTGWRAGEQH
jgi:hypothetical protein